MYYLFKKNVEINNQFGYKRWFDKNGDTHRTDGPAIEWFNGDTIWIMNGGRHRDNDLPAVENVDGSKEWWWKGQLHRTNGPAVEYVILGRKRKEYWLNGKELTRKQWKKEVEKNERGS